MKVKEYCMQIIVVLINFQNVIILLNAENIQDKLLNVRPIHVIRADGACPGKRVPVQVFLQGVQTNTRSASIVNYTIHVKEDLPDKLMLSITLSRCLSRENLDSCEEFYKQQNIDYCQSVNPDTMVPNPLLIPVKPKFKCPIKKNVYEAHNLTFNLTPFLLFDVGDWYWKAYAEIHPAKKNRLIFCFYFEGYVERKTRT